tara:strand:+ start:104 stop:1492 length:1389 start_codon:yes stop_codon:yes gene_type:complete
MTSENSIVNTGDTREDTQNLINSNENINKFVKAKKKLNNKFKVFENVYKFYKHIIMDEILVSLNKSLKFLTKYELIIISIINKYNSDKDGNLNSHQLRMLITVAQRFLFDKIFVNYLLPNLSKYYNDDMQQDVEKLIDMLKLFNKDKSNPDATDSKHEEMRKNIINDLKISKFKLNYDYKVKELNDSLVGDMEDDNLEYDEFTHLTDKEKKDIKDNISSSFINKFETLENKFIYIQSTNLWWPILKDSLIKELTNSNDEYVKSVIIFIKQMLTESISNDNLDLEHISMRKSSKNRKYYDDSNLYKIYNYYLNNELVKILENLDSNSKDHIEKVFNDFNKKLDDEYKQTVANSTLSDATSIYHLRKVKIILTNKFKTYTEIFKSIINANEKTLENSKTPYVPPISISNDKKVSKQDFREIVETLIIYIKQNLLNFFDIYQSYISDLRLQYQSNLFKISDKLND